MVKFSVLIRVHERNHNGETLVNVNNVVKSAVVIVLYKHAKELILKTNPMNVRNVAKPSDVILIFKNMKEITLGEKPHECKKCTEVFRCLSDLRKHERTHTERSRMNLKSVEKSSESKVPYKQIKEFTLERTL